MLLGNMFQQLYIVVDSWFVGNYIGKEALAVVGAAYPIVSVLISFVIGVSAGFTIIVSQYFGAKKYDKIRLAVETIYLFLIVAALIVTFFGIMFSDWIFEFTDLPMKIRPQASVYLSIYLSGIIFFFGFNGTSAILRGVGDSKTPLFFLSLASVTNILLDYVFIVLLQWGVRGAAYATILAQGGALLAVLIYLNRCNKLISIRRWRISFDPEIFKVSLKIGLPSGFQQSIVSLGMVVLLSFVNQFGVNAVAAYTLAMRIDTLAIMPAINFATALSTYVGQNLGAGKIHRLKPGLYATFAMTNIIAVFISLSVIIFRSELMSLFTDEYKVIEIGSEYLAIVGSFYVLFASMLVFGAVMRGSGDTLTPMFITLFALWVARIPAAFLMSQEFGVEGIWWAVPVGWGIGLALNIFYYLTGKWKDKVIVRNSSS